MAYLAAVAAGSGGQLITRRLTNGHCLAVSAVAVTGEQVGEYFPVQVAHGDAMADAAPAAAADLAPGDVIVSRCAGSLRCSASAACPSRLDAADEQMVLPDEEAQQRDAIMPAAANLCRRTAACGTTRGGYPALSRSQAAPGCTPRAAPEEPEQVLVQVLSLPPSESSKTRSAQSAHRSMYMPPTSTGAAKTMRNAVDTMPQTNTGSRRSACPERGSR